MSVSDDSTLATSGHHDGSHDLSGGYDYGVGDSVAGSYEKSPYADAHIVAFDVGPNATRFDVHGTILQQSTELAAKFDPWSGKKEPVPLPELDEDTAHTVFHYLYTGSYQTLNTQAKIEKGSSLSYKIGSCVYCAATRYKLPKLAELAKEKIVTFGESLPISDVLAAARDYAFPSLPEDETWYLSYLESTINSAMNKDPEPFRRPGFITQVEGNSRLLQVVWKTVMSNYARAPVVPDVVEDGAATPTVKTVQDEAGPQITPEVDETQTSQGVTDTSASITELDIASANSDTQSITSNEPFATETEATQDDSLKLEDIEPTVEASQVPEPFTDELGFKSSKTYQQMGLRSDQVAVSDQQLEDTKTSTHTRSDSVVQIDQDIASPSLDGKDSEVVQAAEEGAKIVNGATDGAVAAKKKKQKKKKSSIVF